MSNFRANKSFFGGLFVCLATLKGAFRTPDNRGQTTLNGYTEATIGMPLQPSAASESSTRMGLSISESGTITRMNWFLLN